MSPDPAAIHGLENLNPYSYVEGRPLVAVDPRGREPITLAAILIGVAIGAAIGAATAGVVYTGLGGASGALVAGGVAGAASSTASYLTAAALTGQKVTWQGLALSFSTGLATGALMGWAAHKLFNSTAKAPTGERLETTTQTFKTREAAADWLASRYHERAVINDQEFSVSIIQTKSGEISHQRNGRRRSGGGQLVTAATTARRKVGGDVASAHAGSRVQSLLLGRPGRRVGW
jgi:hypothetical protein